MINGVLFSLLACFWGGSFIAIKYAISDIPAFTAAFYRVFFASIFLAIIYFRSIKLNKTLQCLVNSESIDISKLGDAQNLKDKEIFEFLGDD